MAAISAFWTLAMIPFLMDMFDVAVSTFFPLNLIPHNDLIGGADPFLEMFFF